MRCADGNKTVVADAGQRVPSFVPAWYYIHTHANARGPNRPHLADENPRQQVLAKAFYPLPLQFPP